jgi:hypothetical protein
MDVGKGIEAGSMTSVSVPLTKVTRSFVLGIGVGDGAGGSFSPTRRSAM